MWTDSNFTGQPTRHVLMRVTRAPDRSARDQYQITEADRHAMAREALSALGLRTMIGYAMLGGLVGGVLMLGVYAVLCLVVWVIR